MHYRKCDRQHSLAKRHLTCFLDFLSNHGYTITSIDDYRLLYRVQKNEFVKYLCDLDFNTSECSRLLKDKLLTYLALEQLGIRIPAGTYFLLGNHQYSERAEKIVQSLSHLRYPIICKPNDSSLGKGITVLRSFNEEQIRKAITKSAQYSDILLVQDYLSGPEFRVIAIEGEILLAVEKLDIPSSPKEISPSKAKVFLDIVSKSMKYLGATVCGFDFILQDGLVNVLEINSNPFVFPIREHLSDSTLKRYFLKLEELLRRTYGNSI